MRKFAFGVPLTAVLLAPTAARFGVPAATALLLAPARALASCAMPRPFIAPATGAQLPPSPTLYVFSPWLAANDAGRGLIIEPSTSNGPPISYRVSQVSRAGDLGVYRIDVDSGSARKLDFKVSFDAPSWRHLPIEAKYTINKAWPPPDRSAVKIVGAEGHALHWACSYTSTQTLLFEGEAPQKASAYRVAWASAGGAESGSVVLPPSAYQFFANGRLPASGGASKADLSLGHVSCLGNTFDWRTGPVDVRVTALFADGSESAPPEQALRVKPPPSQAEPPPSIGPTAGEPATPPAPPSIPKPFDPKLGALVAFGSFVTAAVASFFWRRPGRHPGPRAG